MARRTGRLGILALLALLGVSLAAQSMNPDENVRSVHGPWIADRYDASHVLACFNFLDPRLHFPQDAPTLAGDPTRLCDSVQLTAPQMQALQAEEPAGERFHLGDRYRLRLEDGKALTVRVSLLTGMRGTYSSADPSIDSYTGAILAVAAGDLTPFRASHAEAFVLERMDASCSQPAAARSTGWQSPPRAVARIAPMLVRARLKYLSGSIPAGEPPRIALDGIIPAGATEPTLYLARAVWPGTPRSAVVLYAWVLLKPTPQIVGDAAGGTVGPGERQEQQRVVSVVGLGCGQTGIVFDDDGSYHWSHQLLVLDRDGNLRVVHAFGATSD